MDSVLPWRVRTFGGFSVERGGVRHDRFRTRHAPALLVYLSLHADVRHSRERLGELLWPAADPNAARQRLSSALTDLRKVLEADGVSVFLSGRDSIGIHPQMIVSDAGEFNRLVRQARSASRERRREMLRAAMDLTSQGEFLPGFYFDWAVEQASAIEETLEAIQSELPAESSGSSLPAEDPSSLIGRHSEIEVLERLVQHQHRCISILGPGGVGKTRLAMDLFERHAPRFSGPTLYVRLGDTRSVQEFLLAVAQALHLPLTEAETLATSIIAALSEPSLVVLDGLEHLIEELHPILDHLMRSCGHTIFVCTSRRRLDLAGEQSVRIRPLVVPKPLMALSEAVELPSMKLFQARYREAGGGALSESDLNAAASLCRSLDGIPYAIQLAGSAAAAIGFAPLGSRPHLYDLLPFRSPDATNPHASLTSLIDWSLDLLSPFERSALETLAFLPGHFSAEAVLELLGKEIAATLSRLHAQSLLEADGRGQLRMLEMTRHRVLARLAPLRRSEIETDLVCACARIAERLEDDLEGPGQRVAMETALQLWPILTRAMEIAEARNLPNEGLTIGSACSRLFVVRSASDDAVRLIESLLPLPGVEKEVAARAHAVASRHARNIGLYESAERHARKGRELAREIQDRKTEARCAMMQAYLAVIDEDQPGALSRADEALKLAEAAKDAESIAMVHLVIGHANALYDRAATDAQRRASHERTEVAFETALAVARSAQDDLLEGTIQYHRSNYALEDIDLFRARLNSAISIFQTNGWKLPEAMARGALVRRLCAADSSVSILDELRAIQRAYAEAGREVERADHVLTEAEILYRMDRHEEAWIAINDAAETLRFHNHSMSVVRFSQGLIGLALGRKDADTPLLALIEQGRRTEYAGMMAELARSILEVRRGDDLAATKRLESFTLTDKPVKVRHAYADTWVALGDHWRRTNPALAIAAYRSARPIYRRLSSPIDLQRARSRVAAIGNPLSEG